MAFARPIGNPRRSADALMFRTAWAEAAPALVASEAQRQKLVSAKDLRKLRRQVNEKMQSALAVTNEMGSVQEQLRTLSHAVDALSQIMVDELDAVGADMTQSKVEASDQMTTLAKGMQSFTPELTGLRSSSDRCRSAVEAANASLVKLKVLLAAHMPHMPFVCQCWQSTWTHVACVHKALAESDLANM